MSMNAIQQQITIRNGYSDDDSDVARLAALDSAPVPPGPLLLAEVDGRLVAALSLADGGVIADPFTPTLDVVAMLRLRAQQRAGGDSVRQRRWARAEAFFVT